MPYEEDTKRNLRPSNTMDFVSTKKRDTQVMAAFKRWHSKYKRYKKQIPRGMRYRIILHYGLFKIIWDWFILSLVLYTAVEVPFVSSFILPEMNDTHTSGNSSLNIFENMKRRYPDAYPLLYTDMVIDVLFMIDILINFRTTYVKSGEQLITNPWKIALHYLKTYFLVDFVAAIPWELMVSIHATETEEQNSMLFSLLKTARLLRLFRAARKLDRNYEYMTSLLFLMLMFFMLVAHWMACIWYAIGNTETPREPGSWLYSFAMSRANSEEMYPMSVLSIKSRYLCSLYFVMTLCSTVGFGNVAAVTDGELVFCICCMLIGAVMHAAIFGNVTAIIHGQYSSNFRYRKESQQIQEFIRYYNIKNPLARRLREFSRHTWSQTKGTNMPKVLKKFPEGLQYEVRLHMHMTVLSHSFIFRDLDSNCLREVAMKMRLQHHLPSHFITYDGDTVDSLHLVRRGKIDVLAADSPRARFQIREGDAFGANLSQLSQRSKADVSLRAESCVDCHEIKLSELASVLDGYPEERCRLMKLMDSADHEAVMEEKPEARPRSPKREGNGIHTDREETVDDAKEAFVFTNERVKQNTFSMKLLRKKHRKLLRRDTPTTSGETTSEPDANFNKYTSMSSESFALEGRGRLFNITKLSGQVSRPDELRNPACVDSPSDEGPEELLAELQGLEMPCEQCAGEDSPGEVPDSQYKELSRNMQRLEGKFEALIALLQKEKLSGAEDGSAANGDRTTTV